MHTTLIILILFLPRRWNFAEYPMHLYCRHPTPPTLAKHPSATPSHSILFCVRKSFTLLQSFLRDFASDLSWHCLGEESISRQGRLLPGCCSPVIDVDVSVSLKGPGSRKNEWMTALYENCGGRVENVFSAGGLARVFG